MSKEQSSDEQRESPNPTKNWLMNNGFWKRLLLISIYVSAGLVFLVPLWILAQSYFYIDVILSLVALVGVWFFANTTKAWRVFLIILALVLGFLLYPLPSLFITWLTLAGSVVFNHNEKFLLSRDKKRRALAIIAHISFAGITVFLPVEIVSRMSEYSDSLIALFAPFGAILFVYLFLKTNYEHVKDSWVVSEVPWLRMFAISLYAFPVILVFVGFVWAGLLLWFI